MDTNHETTPLPWGTLEDLLLACAVNRHGTDNWNAVVLELQSATSTLPALTSQNCFDKFTDLKRRFMPLNDDTISTTTLIDHLRKIRVQELRREVQRHDVSIVSLELKVKRLEEEREKSLKEEADLLTEKKTSPGNIAGSEESDRSFNESNSTTQQKTETAKNANDVVKREPDPVRTGSDPSNGKLKDEDDNDDNIKNKRNNNNNNNNNNGEKKRRKEKKEMKMRESGLGELMSELGAEKQNNNNNNNSDVQSSASLSPKNDNKKKKKKGMEKKRCRRGSSISGDDEVSPATKLIMPAVKSQPLVQFLGIVRSHRLSSIFERRLRSQESERYKSLIRQHIDLQTIQSRLDKGIYSKCIQKFFRDLLLLFNNAIIFFRKNSQENVAAHELRGVVLKEMREKLGKPTPQPVTIKPEPKQQTISFSKPNKSSSTIVVCGKRSTMEVQPENATKKGDRKDKEVEGKRKLNEKKIDSLVDIDEKGIRKKRTKERLVSGRRNSTTTTTASKNGEIKHQYGGNELSSHDALEMKEDRRENTTRKKQGAASFLKRMKQNSPSEGAKNDDDDDDDDSSEDEGKGGKRKEDQKRPGRNNKEGVGERVTRSSRGRGAREESGRAKRIGRPPKRQALSLMEVSGGTGKRGRDNGNSEMGVRSGGLAKKRTRR